MKNIHIFRSAKSCKPVWKCHFTSPQQFEKNCLVPLCGKEFNLHLKTEIENEMFICGVALYLYLCRTRI